MAPLPRTCAILIATHLTTAIFVTKTEAWPGFIPALHLLLYPTLWDLSVSAGPPATPPPAFVTYASLNRQTMVQQLAATKCALVRSVATCIHSQTSFLWTIRSHSLLCSVD